MLSCCAIASSATRYVRPKTDHPPFFSTRAVVNCTLLYGPTTSLNSTPQRVASYTPNRHIRVTSFKMSPNVYQLINTDVSFHHLYLLSRQSGFGISILGLDCAPPRLSQQSHGENSMSWLASNTFLETLQNIGFNFRTPRTESERW